VSGGAVEQEHQPAEARKEERVHCLGRRSSALRRLCSAFDRLKMKSEEARMLLRERLARYRSLSYEELSSRIGSVEVEELAGPDGVTYQLEFQVFWDDKRGGDVRVSGGIDGGTISALLPLTDSFIRAPDGTFVGE
jgi:hypothetical protein